MSDAMENMRIWDAVKQPPADALKEIGGGRLKGKTDISPIWRYEQATKLWGPCGEGWGYTIDRLWSEPAGDEIECFATVTLWHDVEKNAVQGIGGSKLRRSEKEGFYNDDEGYKMAVTDALSVAFKMLGFGANIYAGKSDSKYVPSPKPSPQVAKVAQIFNATPTEKEVAENKDVFVNDADFAPPAEPAKPLELKKAESVEDHYSNIVALCGMLKDVAGKDVAVAALQEATKYGKFSGMTSLSELADKMNSGKWKKGKWFYLEDALKKKYNELKK